MLEKKKKKKEKKKKEKKKKEKKKKEKKKKEKKKQKKNKKTKRENPIENKSIVYNVGDTSMSTWKIHGCLTISNASGYLQTYQHFVIIHRNSSDAIFKLERIPERILNHF